MTDVLMWIFQIFLALWFLKPALMKLTTPEKKWIESGQLRPDGNVLPLRSLGFLEALGIIGIIVPRLTGVLPILTPVTAVCFAIVMTGAFWVHYKKHDYKILPVIAVAFVLSVSVAWFRFVEVG